MSEIPDLSSLLNIKKSQISNEDAKIACSIVRLVFNQINMCIQTDRSSVKLNAIEKGIIRNMLGERTLNGINNYLLNMYPSDIKKLIDDIQTEINKRN